MDNSLLFIQRLMKISLLLALLTISAIAEYKMIDTKDGTFMYDTETGQTWYYMISKTGHKYFSPMEFLGTTTNGNNRYYKASEASESLKRDK